MFPLPIEFKLATENLSGENWRIRLFDRVDETPQLGWVNAGEKFHWIDRPGETFIWAKNFSGIIGYTSREAVETDLARVNPTEEDIRAAEIAAKHRAEVMDAAIEAEVERRLAERLAAHKHHARKSARKTPAKRRR